MESEFDLPRPGLRCGVPSGREHLFPHVLPVPRANRSILSMRSYTVRDGSLCLVPSLCMYQVLVPRWMWHFPGVVRLLGGFSIYLRIHLQMFTD
jgi:hypothetical protein